MSPDREPAQSSSARLEACLKRIASDPQGSMIFRSVTAGRARADAAAADARLAAGCPLSAIDGVVVSIKDLFDVAGEPTTAGSKMMLDAPPARRDAEVVNLLRRAGAVIIGKTHMTEFAFSAVGANPHFGTPGNPEDETRISGGSSTGAAIALRKGMCEMSVGSDTGGSIRMPSALCGTVGLKPTQRRVSRDGVQALCPSFDTIGALCLTVGDTATLDAILSGEERREIRPASLGDICVAIPKVYFQDDMDDHVRASFEAAIDRLVAAGMRIAEIDIEVELERMNEVNVRGTFPNVESSYVFRRQMAEAPDKIDPFIRSRIERGMAVDAAHYIWMCNERAELMRSVDRHFDKVDFILTPTVPIVASKIEEVADPNELARINLLLLRNTWVSNFFDLPAMSLPCHGSGLPVGLQVVGRHGADNAVFGMGLAIEAALAGAA